MQPNPIETAWMKCNVQKGMFSTEYLVVVDNIDGSPYGEMFVDKGLVKLDRGQDPGADDSIAGQLRVHTTWQKHQADDLISVMLPAATMQNGRFLRVPENWLTSG